MRVPRFHTHSSLAIGTTCLLAGPTAHYALHVLRLSVNSKIILFNGTAGEYIGIIQSTGKKEVAVELLEFDPVDRESSLHTELAIGLSRGDRMDWVIQKATELGVSTIVPLLTERTEVKLKGERIDKKMNHWRQISISACEQSQRTGLPVISEPQKLRGFYGHCGSDKKLILHGNGDTTLPEHESKITSVSLLIGPEGGFTEEEVSLAFSNGFQGFSIGPRVLRTETAPIAALTLAQLWWGDFSR